MRKILDPQVQLVLMVVPAQKSDRYAAIKKLCCIESPVPSQESVHHMFSRISKLGIFHEIFSFWFPLKVRLIQNDCSEYTKRKSVLLLR